MDWVGPLLWGIGGAALIFIAGALTVGLFVATQVAHGAFELEDDNNDD